MESMIENSEIEPEGQVTSDAKAGFFATGGIIGALAASSCCIVPLALTLFGVSGAWMSNLRALSPYQPYFIAMTAIMISFGFYRVYWKSRQACAVDGACARPLPDRLVKSGLWVGTILVLIAFTFPYWFASIEPYLP